MKFATFIHNDDAKCFHVAVKRTHKLVLMARINFENNVLIKKRWAYEKMNVMCSMMKKMR
jgi:hypothetical protein